MLYFLNQDNIDGQTGPIAGNDIAVYHVNTDFKLGKEVCYSHPSLIGLSS